MLEKKYDDEKIRQFMVDHLEKSISKVIVRAALSSNPESVQEVAKEELQDFYWLTNIENITGITNSKAIESLVDFLQVKEKQDTRLNFILQATTNLKVFLGYDGWKEFVEDLHYGLLFFSPNEEITKRYSGFSRLNRKLNQPDLEILIANPWLIPIILYAIYPETIEIISVSISNVMQNRRKRRTTGEQP